MIITTNEMAEKMDCMTYEEKVNLFEDKLQRIFQCDLKGSIEDIKWVHWSSI